MEREERDRVARHQDRILKAAEEALEGNRYLLSTIVDDLTEALRLNDLGDVDKAQQIGERVRTSASELQDLGSDIYRAMRGIDEEPGDDA